jgi:hypothetical protein
MTLTIDLSPEEEANLRARAARWGQDEATYAAGVLRHDIYTLPVDEELVQEQTLADFLEGYIGTVDSSLTNVGKPSDLARNSEEEFGKIMDEKKRQGHV